MIKFVSRAAIAGALLAVAGFASASTVVTVDAKTNSTGGTGVAYDTGVFILENQLLEITATGTWYNHAGSNYAADADGNTHLGTYTIVSDGTSYTFRYGELVGEIGDSGVYFAVGSDYSAAADYSGEVKLYYWDSDNFNNSGSVQATISVVPEPANVALIALGLGAFALTRRRRA